MSGRVVTLHKRPTPGPRIAAWMTRLDACDPKSPAAKAIYTEALDAGYGRELVAALEESAAADRREAAGLRAEIEGTQELLDAVRPVMQGHPDMTVGEALQKLGHLGAKQ